MPTEDVGKLWLEIRPGRDQMATSGLSDLGQVTSTLWASGCLIFAVDLTPLTHWCDRNAGLGGAHSAIGKALCRCVELSLLWTTH